MGTVGSLHFMGGGAAAENRNTFMYLLKTNNNIMISPEDLISGNTYMICAIMVGGGECNTYYGKFVKYLDNLDDTEDFEYFLRHHVKKNFIVDSFEQYNYEANMRRLCGFVESFDEFLKEKIQTTFNFRMCLFDEQVGYETEEYGVYGVYYTDLYKFFEDPRRVFRNAIDCY